VLRTAVLEAAVVPDANMAKKYFDADWKAGVLYKAREGGAGHRPLRLLTRNRHNGVWSIADTWPAGFLPALNQAEFVRELNEISL